MRIDRPPVRLFPLVIVLFTLFFFGCSSAPLGPVPELSKVKSRLNPEEILIGTGARPWKPGESVIVYSDSCRVVPMRGGSKKYCSQTQYEQTTVVRVLECGDAVLHSTNGEIPSGALVRPNITASKTD